MTVKISLSPYAQISDTHFEHANEFQEHFILAYLLHRGGGQQWIGHPEECQGVLAASASVASRHIAMLPQVRGLFSEKVGEMYTFHARDARAFRLFVHEQPLPLGLPSDTTLTQSPKCRLQELTIDQLSIIDPYCKCQYGKVEEVAVSSRQLEVKILLKHARGTCTRCHHKDNNDVFDITFIPDLEGRPRRLARGKTHRLEQPGTLIAHVYGQRDDTIICHTEDMADFERLRSQEFFLSPMFLRPCGCSFLAFRHLQ